MDAILGEEAIINCYNYDGAITFDLAMYREKSKEGTITEKERRQIVQNSF